MSPKYKVGDVLYWASDKPPNLFIINSIDAYFYYYDYLFHDTKGDRTIDYMDQVAHRLGNSNIARILYGYKHAKV